MSGSKVFNANSTAREIIEGHNLKGYEAIVTGGSSGLGLETVRCLAIAGARIIVAVRNVPKGQKAVEEIIKETGNNQIEVEELELASLKSVRAFVSNFLKKNRSLNLLINNAGIMACPLSYTEDGFESQFATNFLGHFALTLPLIPALKEGAKKIGKNSRVVNLSSSAHWGSGIRFDDINFRKTEYLPFVSYGQSKTAPILFSVELTRRYAKDGIISNAVMPGVIQSTGLFKHMNDDIMKSNKWMDKDGNLTWDFKFKTIEQGTATTIYAAVSPEFENRGGLYLEDCAISQKAPTDEPEIPAEDVKGYKPFALDPVNAERLWNVSEEFIKQ